MKKEIMVLMVIFVIFLAGCKSIEDIPNIVQNNNAIDDNIAPSDDTNTGNSDNVVNNENTDNTNSDVNGLLDEVPVLPEEVSETQESTNKNVIEILNDKFEPETLNIKVGDTVVFKNVRDITYANNALIIGLRSCLFLKSTIFKPGEQFEYTFDKIMECNFIDGIRNIEHGKINVRLTDQHVINVLNDKFEPETLNIQVGDTVIFKNMRDTAQLNKTLIVGLNKCASLKSTIYGPGNEFEYTFDKAMECEFIDGVKKIDSGHIVVK